MTNVGCSSSDEFFSFGRAYLSGLNCLAHQHCGTGLHGIEGAHRFALRGLGIKPRGRTLHAGPHVGSGKSRVEELEAAVLMAKSFLEVAAGLVMKALTARSTVGYNLSCVSMAWLHDVHVRADFGRAWHFRAELVHSRSIWACSIDACAGAHAHNYRATISARPWPQGALTLCKSWLAF